MKTTSAWRSVVARTIFIVAASASGSAVAAADVWAFVNAHSHCLATLKIFMDEKSPQ